MADATNGFDLDRLLSSAITSEASEFENPACAVASLAEYCLVSADVASSLAFGAVRHVTTHFLVVREESGAGREPA
jgi:hypothetical protein